MKQAVPSLQQKETINLQSFSCLKSDYINYKGPFPYIMIAHNPKMRWKVEGGGVMRIKNKDILFQLKANY